MPLDQTDQETISAWHFADDRLRDGAPLPSDSEALNFSGNVAICRSGLHASRRLVDALKYAPGNTLCRVECDGVSAELDDKLVCSSRTIVWRLDAEEVFREFARKVALDVADYWDMPDNVRKFLETGKDNLRVAARGEAMDASREYVALDDPRGAAAAEASRAAAARTHPARATALASAWAAVKATQDEETWARYDEMLEAMVEIARASAPADEDEWSDFGDDFDRGDL